MRLFALGGQSALADAVAASIGIELDPLEEREFPDGEHKSRPLVSVRKQDVYVVAGLHGRGGRTAGDRLLRLLFFMATCRENGADRVTAVVPYLPFMRKERQTKPRDPVTSRYVAELFEAVGTSMVVTLEVHNPAAFQNAFRCPTTHLDAHHLLARRMKEIATGGAVVLSPDSGGMHRANLVRDALQREAGAEIGMAMMEKHRSLDILSGNLFAGEVHGADVFIVDDIIATGGTILRAAEACRERGANRVFALATHGLFSPEAGQLFEQGRLDGVIVTDSTAPFSLPAGATDRLEVLGCGPLLGQAIARLHGGGSINRLLNPQG
ncbi:ribose-phosphate diphosphokinase [Devosia nitrariae]|uniref:ribose-phosphate diphosphokinase n=1 Tax=Devosia nitrariae TaxID=2071872 RepID=A0ABQ5W9I3_9HYPH|nr:ribose-phosphate pyrophosphokinase [Devosia nitrariae]GLQ56595.1 ribose-phosphate pyrophosphokinase [Devosia nitrariae]